jgi:hypothetical protein
MHFNVYTFASGLTGDLRHRICKKFVRNTWGIL